MELRMNADRTAIGKNAAGYCSKVSVWYLIS